MTNLHKIGIQCQIKPIMNKTVYNKKREKGYFLINNKILFILFATLKSCTIFICQSDTSKRAIAQLPDIS